MNFMKFLVIASLWAGLWMVSAPLQALDSRANVERAVQLIESKQYTLARSYLDPALIDPRLSPGERSRAYYLRGYSYLVQNMPVSARKDYNRALEFNPNNPVVLLGLGVIHASGQGTVKNESLALSLFERAANLGYDRAQFRLGRAYLYGEGVTKNVEAARTSLTEAAKQDHIFAMMNLAASYRVQHVADPQPDLALAWYKKAHAAGEPGALLSMGFMHANGELGQPNPKAAIGLFQQALDEGLDTAAVHLAYAYLTGSGVAEDTDKAFELYTQAADTGLPAAYMGLGHMYEFGVGVKENKDTALAWYVKAADEHEPEALNRLVAFYLRQEGDEARGEALKWSRRAAEMGHPQARNDYAWLLATSKFEGLRNGTLALDQAIKAVEQESSASYLDTLAAAYAELGNFDKAIAVQREAIAAITDSEGEIRDDLEERLQYYERSEAWRE
jgi:TPR repeat protein